MCEVASSAKNEMVFMHVMNSMQKQWIRFIARANKNCPKSKIFFCLLRILLIIVFGSIVLLKIIKMHLKKLIIIDYHRNLSFICQHVLLMTKSIHKKNSYFWFMCCRSWRQFIYFAIVRTSTFVSGFFFHIQRFYQFLSK